MKMLHYLNATLPYLNILEESNLYAVRKPVAPSVVDQTIVYLDMVGPEGIEPS